MHFKALCTNRLWRKRIPKHTLRIMKFTAILLFIACMQVSARGISQTVTLSLKNASLEQVFDQVKRQTGLSFIWDEQTLRQTRPVDIGVKNASVAEVMDLCLKDQPLTYRIIGKIVVINGKATPSLQNGAVLSPADLSSPELTFTIHGHVIDSLGNPLAGASVMVRGSKKGTATDASGNFELHNIPLNAVLVISFSGYEPREFRNLKMDNATPLTVTLRRNNSPLDVMQVVAYGTSSRRFSVGSIATVDAETIAKQPVNNVLLALQGQVPGLAVNASSGAPGGAVRLQVRGQNTLRGSNASLAPYDQPLIIIDGLPFAPQNNNTNLLNGFGITNTLDPNFSGGMSPFNSINPLDIESISILKDADATSIYGTQGANGVVLITTKKAKGGKTTLNMSVNQAINVVSRPLEMLNTQQYLDLRREALSNDGLSLAATDASSIPDLKIFDQNKYTNWYNQFFNKTASNTNVYAALTGGTNQTNFVVSTGYTNVGYNSPGGFADQRFTLHTAFHHEINSRLTIDFGTDYSYDKNNTSGAPTAFRTFMTPPNYPDLLDASGNLNWYYQGISLANYQQYGFLKQPSSQNTYNLNTHLNIHYRLAPGLNLGINAGYSRMTTSEYQAFPLSSQDPQSFPVSNATFGNNTFETLNIEPQLDYKLTIGNGTLTALAGTSYKKNQNNSTILTGDNYATDALLGSITGAAAITASDAGSIYKYSAVFGRVNYIYDQKYIVNITGRRDGSSNFGPGNQFGNFGSAGLGWIFSEEQIFKNAAPFISYAKLSGNYGTNGSDGMSAYKYRAFWQPTADAIAFQGTIPYQALNLYNPDYGWSVKKTLNLSLDLGLLKDRILLNATWYQSRTSNQLTNYSLPIQTGFSSIYQNFNATVQDKGWEFTLSSTNIKTKNFNWSTNFNIALNRNKLLAFPDLATSPYASYYTIGKSITSITGYKYKDVNPATGVFEFYTANGQTTYDPNGESAYQGGDRQIIADLQPKFSGGLGNTFSYKSFSLMAFFQFSKQTSRNYLADLYSQATPGNFVNLPVQILDHWRAPGDISNIQKVTSGVSFNSQVQSAGVTFYLSSGAYSDASYVRLKTVSLSYTLPDSYLKRVNIKSCHVFVNAQNLLTITNFKVGDPELNSVFSFPLQRTINAGLSFNL